MCGTQTPVTSRLLRRSRPNNLFIQTVAVIGAGSAGRAFALRAAVSGLDVVLEDVMPSNLRRAQDDYTALAMSSPGAIRYALTVEDAVHDADIAVDFVPDELESKLEIFCLLDRMAPPRTLLCTPTRVLSITDLASCTYRPSLCIGLRGSAPNSLEAPIDILRSRFADPAAMKAVSMFLSRLALDSQIVDDTKETMLVKNLSVAEG
jgi:3-hydroxybutyryl-CoA dehydrogenase